MPPYGSGEFVCQMEDTLAVYKLPYDPDYPQVCLDETSKQLIAEVCPPLPCGPGQPHRYESHYQREGVCQLFLLFEPLAGWRHVAIRDHKGAVDWAEVIAELLEVHYPQAKRVRLVLDNLNTHAGGSLYQAFAPERARALYERLEIHYTPKQGSWLNMAEIELSVLTGQCLDRRIGSKATLQREVAAWERQRNEVKAQIDWRFTTDTARIKLKKLYPTFKT
jgi:DDE superfamily endonuclease